MQLIHLSRYLCCDCIVQEHGGEPIIPYSAQFEQEVFDMPSDEAEKHCEEVGATSMIPKIVTTGFKAIQLIYFFTAGPDEVKCWQIRKLSKAPQAAGKLLIYACT